MAWRQHFSYAPIVWTAEAKRSYLMNRRLFSLGIPGAAFLPGRAQAAPPAGTHSRESVRDALLEANPELSKFKPLRRILFYDDFDNGHNGWCELEANHNGNLDELCPAVRDMRDRKSVV